ncbi:hypothetical protein SAMN05192539_1004341 [Paraburkholderia diazotrophica]|uniref:Uncharacterized protein n=1 Tax=Paraburkholderia diazotrophica TaxID=667676 RepID=A0A1H6U465_9BURK|nr:hypothetical protein SAMN05192539_1004341 [Paraburkholderia diazotrophica]
MRMIPVAPGSNACLRIGPFSQAEVTCAALARKCIRAKNRTTVEQMKRMCVKDPRSLRAQAGSTRRSSRVRFMVVCCECSQEDVFARRTTGAVPEAFFRCVSDAITGATLAQCFVVANQITHSRIVPRKATQKHVSFHMLNRFSPSRRVADPRCRAGSTARGCMKLPSSWVLSRASAASLPLAAASISVGAC